MTAWKGDKGDKNTGVIGAKWNLALPGVTVDKAMVNSMLQMHCFWASTFMILVIQHSQVWGCESFQLMFGAGTVDGSLLRSADQCHTP